MKVRDPTEHRLCGAKTRGGKPCRRPCLLGGVRCRLHGGASPQALRKAEETLAEWRARRVAQLDKGFDVLLNDPDGRKLAGLIVKQPGLIARLLVVADRMRGGDERVSIQGPDGGPVRVEVDTDPIVAAVANDPAMREAAMRLLGSVKKA